MEEDVHKCSFLTAVLYWRGSRNSVDYKSFTLFCKKLSVSFSPMDKAALHRERKVWSICKGTHGTFGFGFKKREQIILASRFE